LEHRWKSLKKTELAKQELNTPEAKSILKWFCLEKELSKEQKAKNRNWWKKLPIGWKRQFKSMLSVESGVDARNKSANAKKDPSDKEILFFLESKEFYLHDESPVTILMPL